MLHTEVANGAPAVLVHCRGAAGMLGHISLGSDCFCWASPRVHAAPHDFKGPRQCMLEKMRSGTSASQRTVIGGGHGAPSGRHHVVLAGEEVTQH